MTKVEHWICDCPQWFAIPTTYSQCAWCKAKQKYYNGKEKHVRFHKIFRPRYEPYQPKPQVKEEKPYIFRGRPRGEKNQARFETPEIPQICHICYGDLEKQRVSPTRDWTCNKCKNSISRKNYYKNGENKGN